jgi:oligopeptidase B
MPRQIATVHRGWVALSVLICTSTLLLSTGCTRSAESSPSASKDARQLPAAPTAAARPHPIASSHGTRNDEYYWLRDDKRQNPEMLAYLKAENAYTDAVLAHTRPLQQTLYDEIVGRIEQDDSSVPYKYKGNWYYRRYESGKQYAIYVRKAGSLEAPEQILLDENRMAQGHSFFEISNWEVSPDGKLIAWTEDAVGRRQNVLRIKNIASGEVLPDRIENVSDALAWAADNRTLLYIAKDPVTLLADKVRKHVLGTPSTQDALVYEQTDKTYNTWVSTSKDEKFVVISSDSTLATELQVARANDPQLKFEPLLPRERNHEYQAAHLGNRWIIRTNWQAQNFRIVTVDERDVADRSKWRDVVAHREDAFIDSFDVFTGFLAVQEYSNGLSNVRIAPWSGGAQQVITSEEPAYTARLSINPEIDTKLLRYSFTSPATPNTTYDFDTTSGSKTLLKRDAVLGNFDAAQYRTEHLWASARDGTKVPVSLVYRRGTPLDGTAPLLQFGYGAYGISMNPIFSHSTISMLDRGFIYAIAHVRGGQEMGRGWYDNGRMLKKVNSFTDFIDVTRYLVAQKYADPQRVFALGGSAGGMLMGAIANLAPDSYRGIVALVPFVDVVTTMLDDTIPLTTNEYDEWGNPSSKEYYDYMLAYSPYDNVKAQSYPALYVGTGLWDSQVQYYEPAKWVARLRKLKTDRNPLVFRIDMEAGHGGKSGRFERYRETAEQFAFMLDLAGVTK